MTGGNINNSPDTLLMPALDGSGWQVYAPWSSTVVHSTADGKTTTSCIQEAIDYAAAHGTNLNIQGGGAAKAIVEGSISGTTLTVTKVISGIVQPGMMIFDQIGLYPGSITNGAAVTGFGTGNGGVGTYPISAANIKASNTLYLSTEGYAMGVSTTIRVPTMRFWTWRINGVTIDFGFLLEDGIVFDSLANCQIDWTAMQLVYRGQGAAVHFQPINACPGDPTYGVGINIVNIPTIQAGGAKGGGGTCVRFTPGYNQNGNYCTIAGNIMRYTELNGAGTPGTIGIQVDNDLADKFMFTDNMITVSAVHDCTKACLIVGTEQQSSPGSISGNEWHAAGYTFPHADFLVAYGSNDIYNLNIVNAGAAGTRGIVLNPGADNNALTVGNNDCPTPVVDNGEGNTINGQPTNGNGGMSLGAW